MPPTKKSTTASSTFVPSSDHEISVGAAHQLASSITAYGKVISAVTISPSDAGTVHPQGKEDNLQLALVFGICDQGQCIRLPQPQKVYLPAPDGPADGCGWDPSQYLSWKNLPREWNTVHVQTQTKPLAMALRTAETLATKPMADAGTAPPLLSDVLCIKWVGLPSTIFVDGTLTIQTFWERNHKTPFTFNEQVSLANAIKTAYGKEFSPQVLTGGTTINTLAGWIPATL
jgi:hypothetical protein